MSGKAKPKPATVLIPPTRQPGSRSTSGTPVNPSATPALPDATPPPAPVPAPKTPKDAISLLSSHGLITRNPTLNPSAIVGMLHGLASFPKVIENGHTPIVSAIALLVPLAMESVNTIRADLDEFKAKVVSLEEKVDKVLELVENPMSMEEEVGGKLDKMMSVLTESASKSQAAEQAAVSTQQKLTTLLESQGQPDGRPWSQVTQKNSRTHGDSAPRGPKQPSPPNTGNTAPKLNSQALQRAFVQATTILVQPNKGADTTDLDKLAEPALLKWIGAAMTQTWIQLADAGHLGELGVDSPPHISFHHATRLPSGGILFEIGCQQHAALLSTVRVSKFLAANMGNVECRGQRADILLESAPVEVDPEDPEFARALERENQIESESALYCSWVKPVSRRRPGQTRGVFKVSMRAQAVADELIGKQGYLNGQKVQFKRIVEEPTQCLKCQRFGHRAAKCESPRDICSQCGGEHRSSCCPDRSLRFCVSCNTDAHASWLRSCPAYQKESARINKLRPENCRKFFDPDRVDPPHQPAAFVPAAPAAPVAPVTPVAPAAPVAPVAYVAPVSPVAPAIPATLLSDIVREDSTVPRVIIPAYYPRQPPRAPSPPADTPGDTSPAWSIESKHGDAGAEPIELIPITFDAPPAPVQEYLEDAAAVVTPSTPPSSRSPRFLLSVYKAPSRSRSVSVSSVSSSASTITSLSHRMASVPGGFDSPL